jgi:hypothetical protein
VMKIAIGDQVRVHFHPPYPIVWTGRASQEAFEMARLVLR